MSTRNASFLRGMAAALALAAGVPQAVSAAALHLRVTHRKVIPRSERPIPARYVPRGTGKTRVSVTFKRTPIRTALRLLFRRANQDYVLGSGVSGTTTATLHNVPFATALHNILSVNSVPLVSSKIGKVYVIKGRHQVTYRKRRRVYRRKTVYHPPAGYPARSYHVPGTSGTVRVVP